MNGGLNYINGSITFSRSSIVFPFLRGKYLNGKQGAFSVGKVFGYFHGSLS